MAAKYDVRTSSDGQYYFNLKAANGKVILTSERYTTKANALNGIRSIQENATVAARFDRRTSKARDPYFVLKAGNGEPIGRSEMYSSTGARDNGIRSVEANAPTARVNDLTDSSTHVADITGHVQAPVSTETRAPNTTVTETARPAVISDGLRPERGGCAFLRTLSSALRSRINDLLHGVRMSS